MQCFRVYTLKYGFCHFYIKYIVRWNTLQMSLENLGTEFPASNMVFNIHGKQIVKSLWPLWIYVNTLSLMIYGMSVCQCWKYGHSFVLYSICGSLSVQCISITQSCPIFWEPMDCHMPGLPVHHQLLDFTHVHWVRDSVQPSLPLLPPLLLPSMFPSIGYLSHESAFHASGQISGLSASAWVLPDDH